MPDGSKPAARPHARRHVSQRHDTHIVFCLNLLQDVAVCRPLVNLVVAELDVRVGLLVSAGFLARDTRGVWMAELRTLQAELGTDVIIYETPLDAFLYLQGKTGVLVAGSESSLRAHVAVHEVMRASPPGFLRVTLQHGFECVGFLQNREQTVAHGHRVTFAADVLCGWFGTERMTAMPTSERSKLYVTGPQAVLQAPPVRAVRSAAHSGLVCENMHSVRFNVEGDRTNAFMDDFFAFCGHLEAQGLSATLRPHPGGQYVLKNAVTLPANVSIENAPIYRVDLAGFDYGISAPSSVLIDMVLAGIPVAVWSDPELGIDRRHYEGLRFIAGREEWQRFAADAIAAPGPILEEQKAFLANLAMPIEPADVRSRFARLFAGAGAPVAVRTPVARPLRVLLMANSLIPSLEISFLRPLRLLRDRGLIELALLTEELLAGGFADPLASDAGNWVAEQVARFAPDMLAMCRYSGPHGERAVTATKAAGGRVVYHLDDDLLNIPAEIVGETKWRSHNAPRKLASIRASLAAADLVYCSTPSLMDRYVDYGHGRSIVAGDLYCSAEIRRAAGWRRFRKVGYMGFDHAYDLALVLPAIVSFLRRNPDIRFELFGSVKKPAELDEFGDRISVVPPVRGYDEFLSRLSSVDWDVGICPLADLPFNLVKADTKWAEYTSVGIAVVASAHTVYDDACSDGCGIAVSGNDAWIAALEKLCNDDGFRQSMIEAAQRKLERRYDVDRLRAQVLWVAQLAGTKLSGALADYLDPDDLSEQPVLHRRTLTV